MDSVVYPFEIWDMYKHSDVQGVGALFVALFFEKIKKSQKNHKNGLCNHAQITLRSYIYIMVLSFRTHRRVHGTPEFQTDTLSKASG